MAQKSLEEIIGYGPPPNAKVSTNMSLPDEYKQYLDEKVKEHLRNNPPPPPVEPKPEKKKTNWWDIGMGALQVIGGVAEAAAGITLAVFTAPSVAGALAGAYMAVDGYYNMKSGIAQMMNGYYGEERYDTRHGLEEAFASAGALVGNEKLGRSIYLTTSMLNPSSTSGKIKAGLNAVEAVTKTTSKTKAIDKVVDANKGTGEINYVNFNKTHKDSLPKPKGDGPNGGKLQSHHGLQQEWAKNNLSQYGYDSKLAPTITIETGKGLPHTAITNAQTARRNERMASGVGKWSTTLQEELQFMVDDLTKAGFSRNTTSQVLEQQYKMLDKLGVKFGRIDY